jgi:hypothetical protein
MEQIRCPKCKERHWVCAEALACLESPDLGPVVEALRQEIEVLRAKLSPKPKVDRKAYMREYMRKRRSK